MAKHKKKKKKKKKRKEQIKHALMESVQVSKPKFDW